MFDLPLKTEASMAPHTFCYKVAFFKLFIHNGVQPINNVVMASGGQQRDSDIHIRVSRLPKRHE